MSTVTSMALLKTTGSPPAYLGVINDGSKDQGFLEFSTEDILTKNAKFAVEYAYGDFVHIRSCLTNKYWIRSSSDGNWIVAKGVSPVVDTTSWTCTLFRIDIIGDNFCKLYHVQSSRVVGVPWAGLDRDSCLSIDPAAVPVNCVLTDYDTLVILPKFVAFKGSNGLFYKNYSGDKDDADFSVSDMADVNIKCEIQYTSGGNIRVKASNSPDDMFWTYLGPNLDDLIGWAKNDPKDINQMFAPIRIKKNKIALRNLGNGKICKRGDVKNTTFKKDRLVATANGLEADTYLEVFETVFSRSVKTYDFDLDNARIYDVGLLYSNEHVWDNYSNVAESGTVNGTIKTKKMSTYSNDVNVSGTVETTVETGVPFIVEGKISVSATAGYTHGWGTTVEEEQEVGDVFTVVVQPTKRTVAKGVATKGTCDVPFSYVRKDYPLSGGAPYVTKLKDGVFTTTNAYSFQDQVRYEELPTHDGPEDEAPTMCIQRPKKKRAY